ncbi:hypothetical protein ACTXT7_007942 [Hymenolepis weldensis]
MVDLAKWNKKTRFLCLVRRLGPVEYERYSKFVISKKFDELRYSETEQKNSSAKPWLPLRTSLKLIEENSNVKLATKGVKIANLTRDFALSDSDAMPMRLVHKMSASMSQSIQFVAQLNPPVEQKLSLPCQLSRG